MARRSWSGSAVTPFRCATGTAREVGVGFMVCATGGCGSKQWETSAGPCRQPPRFAHCRARGAQPNLPPGIEYRHAPFELRRCCAVSSQYPSGGGGRLAVDCGEMWAHLVGRRPLAHAVSSAVGGGTDARVCGPCDRIVADAPRGLIAAPFGDCQTATGRFLSRCVALFVPHHHAQICD